MKTAFRVLTGTCGRITADRVGRAWPTIRSRCSTGASRKLRPARSCAGQFNVPHSWLYMNVKNPDGTETLWSFEGSAPPSLLQRGITGSTFEPGATVTVSYCPLQRRTPGWRPRLGAAGQRHVREPVRRRLRRQRQGDREVEGLARGGIHLEHRGRAKAK